MTDIMIDPKEVDRIRNEFGIIAFDGEVIDHGDSYGVSVIIPESAVDSGEDVLIWRAYLSLTVRRGQIVDSSLSFEERADNSTFSAWRDSRRKVDDVRDYTFTDEDMHESLHAYVYGPAGNLGYIEILPDNRYHLMLDKSEWTLDATPENLLILEWLCFDWMAGEYGGADSMMAAS
jgi:hypothetical protein